MIIRLPKNFTYNHANTRVYVINDVLYLEGVFNFENIMHKLTYALRGEDRCIYCGSKLTSQTRTLDHMYPRRFGGPTIPNNLVPCCKKCNSNKQDMTYKQYQIWRKIKEPKEKEIFLNQSIQENIQVLKSKNFVVGRGWITFYNISKVYRTMSFSNLNKEKYWKVKNYFDKWHQYPAPIIVSSDGWILDGKRIIKHASSNRRWKVKAIILENVVVKRTLTS